MTKTINISLSIKCVEKLILITCDLKIYMINVSLLIIEF